MKLFIPKNWWINDGELCMFYFLSRSLITTTIVKIQRSTCVICAPILSFKGLGVCQISLETFHLPRSEMVTINKTRVC